MEFIKQLDQSLTVTDDVLRVTGAAKSIFFALYFFTDTLAWLQQSAKFMQFGSLAIVQKNSARFWLAALVFSWLGHAYKMHELSLRETVIIRAQQVKDRELNADVQHEHSCILK